MNNKIIFILFLLFSLNCSAYSPDIHSYMSEMAVEISALNSDEILSDMLGLQQGISVMSIKTFPLDGNVRDSPYAFATDGLLSISQVVGFGAYWEDMRRITQALFHFYDPT